MQSKVTLLAWAASALAIAAASAPAQGQDVIVMRRVLAPPTRTATTPAVPTPTVTPTPGGPKNAYYSWQTTDWQQGPGACGAAGTETRTVACKRTDGVTVADAMCTGNGSGSRPDASRPTTLTASCSFKWTTSDWSQGGSTCGSSVQTRDVSCFRSDGTSAPGASCPQPAPSASQTISDYSGCSFGWDVTAWSAPDTTCGTATETRVVTCKRADGTVTADESKCAPAGARPDTTQQVEQTTGCTATWAAGDYGAAAPACGDSSRTRTVTCHRSDGRTVDDAQCAPTAKPGISVAVKDYTTCADGRTPEHPYLWKTGDWTGPSTTCGDATSTRTAQCLDDGGATVADAMCVGAKPTLSKSSHETSGCGYSWQTGDYSDPQQACGATVRTRAVSCMRSDNVTVSDSQCAGDKPGATTPATDYSACTFGWAATDWSAWSTTCGDATQTRSAYCQRADGSTVADAECAKAGTRPLETQTSHQVSGCGYTWAQGDWAAAPACGSTTQTRTVTCHRADGTDVDDAQCSQIGAKPAATGTTTDYSTCSFTWSAGTYAAPKTTCGTETHTRAVTCQRSDGTAVDAAQCAPGTKPDASETVTYTTGCTYAWASNAYGSAVPACGASTRTRTNYCRRSDGTTVDAALCTGTPPDTTLATTDYTTCGYDWAVGQWSTSGLCGQSATQSRTVTCQRSDTTTVGDSLCTSAGAGAKPSPTQTVTEYSGCGYSWKQTVGAWSSTCSDAATRTNVVTCQRSDGVTVADSLCVASARPTSSDTQAVTTSCTYAPTYGAYSTCTSSTAGSTKGTQSAPITSCTRSDGKVMPLTSCTPQTSVVACTPPNTSDQYFRQPLTLYEPYTLNNKYLNTSTTASIYNVEVGSTVCWDAVAGKASTAANCNALAYGANIYDVVGLPATFVPDLHELYVNKADVNSAMPNGDYFVGGSVANACTGAYSTRIGTTGSWTVWKVLCGTPDTADHYSRTIASLYDPYTLLSNYNNTSATATTYSMSIGSTNCWDSVTGAAASSTTKCSYLPKGANQYDLVTFPATYVKDLREIYLNQSDLSASQAHANVFNGVTVTSFCNGGYGARIGIAGSWQTWTLKCGAPDAADHYARGIAGLYDPYTLLSNYSNPSFTATSYNMAVSSTNCWDSTTGAFAASATKCSYLMAGPNQYDLVTFPATYVKDLREIYLNQSDLSASQTHANVFNGVTVSSFCNGGYGARIGIAGTWQTWTLKCGTPDTPDHYARDAGTLYDPGQTWSYYTYNTDFAATTYKMLVNSTTCWDTATNAVASSAAKCSYITKGANSGDTATFPATFVKDLREVYLTQTDLQAAEPHANSVNGYTITNFCAGSAIKIGGSSNWQAWTARCGTPDTPDHYSRNASSLYDPGQTWSYYTYNTSFTATSYQMIINSVNCWDTRTNALSTVSTKCDYLPTGPTTSTTATFPATFVQGLREVYVNQADLQAAEPHASNFGGVSSIATFCAGTAVKIGTSSTWQTWTLKCGTPDNAEHYAKYANVLGDPYSNYATTAARTVNNTAVATLSIDAVQTACWDTTANAGAAAAKCAYLANQSPAIHDRIAVPAVWDTAGKTVTVKTADIKALDPYITTAALNANVCGISWQVGTGVTGVYKVVCQ